MTYSPTQHQITLDSKDAMLVLIALRVSQDVLPTADRWRLQQAHNAVAEQLDLDN